jgi:radical SAM protein with 4Fe4S-binding SPASM domain
MGHARKQLLSIYVSSICSLKCVYCALSSGKLKIDKEDLAINLDFAFKGIDDFFRDYPSRGIRFYSAGEVTTQMTTFKQITQYIKDKNEPNTYLELQTNGYFSEENANWIEQNMDFVWVSFDGLPEFQDENRPTVNGQKSSNVVIQNIVKFSQSAKVDVGVRATLTPNMVDKQREIIDFLKNLNVKYVSVERAYSSVNNQFFTEEVTDPIYFAEKFIDAHNYAKKNGIFYNHFNMVNFDEPCRFFCRSCIPYPHLTTDGYVTCCDMAPYGKEKYSDYTLPGLVYGKYDKEKKMIIYDEKQIYHIRQKNVDNLSKTVCKGCDIIDNCAGGCLGQSYNNTGEIISKCDWDCAVTKHLAKYLPLNKGLYPILHP